MVNHSGRWFSARNTSDLRWSTRASTASASTFTVESGIQLCSVIAMEIAVLVLDSTAAEAARPLTLLSRGFIKPSLDFDYSI